LGLSLTSAAPTLSNADPFVELLIEIRNELRKDKQWDLSDKIRDQLEELGVSLEDGKEGTAWRWK
jgi:cysteinyl-tRNA synthetase